MFVYGGYDNEYKKEENTEKIEPQQLHVKCPFQVLLSGLRKLKRNYRQSLLFLSHDPSNYPLETFERPGFQFCFVFFFFVRKIKAVVPTKNFELRKEIAGNLCYACRFFEKERK